MISREEIFDAARKTLSAKLENIRASLKDLEKGIKDDSKSTAGDKHETSRAMAHLEQEKLASQLALIESQLASLEKIHHNVARKTIVQTDKGTFLIGPAMGKIIMEQHSFQGISSSSPLGALLNSALQGSNVTYNGVNYSIHHKY